MTSEPLTATRAVELAKFLILALGEALDLASRPWDPVTLEQAYDPATPPFGVARIADRLRLAVAALADVVPVRVRDPKTVGGFSKDDAKQELGERVRALESFVVEARRVTDPDELSRAARTVFLSTAVTVSTLLAEAENSVSRQGWLNRKEVASEGSPAFPD